MALFVALPCMATAQSEWEVPDQKSKQERQTLFGKSKTPVDPKYLAADAVPMVDGKIVFTLDEDVPGKNAQEIYDIVYSVLERMVKAENQFEESKIALVNKAEHVIAAKFREWLVFKSSALALDRTVFNYTIIATCTDGHLNLTMSRMSYAYEMDRDDSSGMQTSAEEWITDEYALNKARTKLLRHSGKFRQKTIDRKDEIFQIFRNALKK
jgi:colicin import membrane protein